MKRGKFLLLTFGLFCLFGAVVWGSDGHPVYKSEVENNYEYLIDDWDRLPFKDIRVLDSGYINWVNNNHGQTWDSTPSPAPDKCLSFASATINDWYNIQMGKPLGVYQNYINNRTENGTNPRSLEAVYLTRSGFRSYYDFIPFDPVTGEKMPYDIKGYADIMTGNFPTWIDRNDELLGSDYKINVYPDLFAGLSSFKAESFFGGHWIISPSYAQIKNLINKYGIVFAQLETGFVPVHAATLIGYGNFDCDRDGDTENIFWIHETYSTEWDGNPTTTETRYKCIEASDISEVLSLYDPQWPTFHQNNRRTGFTTFTGDLDPTTTIEDLTYEGSAATDYWDNPAFADIDDDGKQEIIVGTSSDQNLGRAFAIDDDGEQIWSTTKQLGNYVIVPRTPSIDDLNNDGHKEVVFGDWDGKLYVLNGRNGKVIDYFRIPSKNGDRGIIDGTAIIDVNLDGNKEIIFMDVRPVLSWPAYIYAYKLQNNRLVKVWESLIGNSTDSAGSEWHPAIANIDNDPYPEIVITAPFGVQTFNGEDGSTKWKKDLLGAYATPVIADVNNDNKYEIIVATVSNLIGGETTYNRTYILDASDGNILNTINHVYRGGGEATPVVANLDNDDNLEIVVALNNAKFPSATKGKIICYDGNNANQDCSYDDGGNLGDLTGSPSIADIDGDNEKEILFSTENGDFYVIDESGNFEWKKTLASGLFGSPAIGDYDGEADAEVAVIHYPFGGSSLATASIGNTTIKLKGTTFLEYFKDDVSGEIKFDKSNVIALTSGGSAVSVLGGFNKQPILNPIDNIIAIEGDFIEINATAHDNNSDIITYYYSSPLNASGKLQTLPNNHSGDYEVVVSASDGNLTDSKIVNLKILRHDAKKIDYFNDSLTNKELVFASSSNETIYVNLPNESRLWLTKLNLRGKPLVLNDTNYQEPGPVVIVANDINNTGTESSLLVDKNWNTYYSAGSYTGAIVEITNLSVPSNPAHIMVHLKLRVFNSGNGRFAIYNYNKDYYEVVTSSIPAINESFQEVYFDVYNSNSSLWTANSTNYNMKIDNINDYINNSKIRWYYRYINGDFASQKIYESEVKFVTDTIYPKNVSIDFGNNGVDTYFDELHETTVHLDHFNNAAKSETFVFNNNSSIRHLKIPKEAELTYAILKVGNNTVTHINATLLEISENSLFEDIQSANLHSPAFGGGQGGNSTIHINESMNYSYNFVSEDFDAQYSWSAGCAYGPVNGYVLLQTQLDKDDWYWDYDEDKHTIIEGVTLDIRTYCQWNAAYSGEILKQDTDGRDGNENYDQVWTTGAGSTNWAEVSSISFDSGDVGDVWELGYSLCDITSHDPLVLFNACDATDTTSRENFYIQECIVSGKNWGSGSDESHVGCADNQECYDPGGNGRQNYCRTPTCSPACAEWEHDVIANHVCNCALDTGRCDTSKYGWQNVADNQYCNATHYPSSTPTITCPENQDWSIINHVETCTTSPGRCSNANTYINATHYCDQYNYTILITSQISLNNTFVTRAPLNEIDEINIKPYLENSLDNCEPDAEGYCLVPLNFSSEYNTALILSEININYETPTLDFSDEIQDFVLKCGVGNCSYPISIISQIGKVNVTQLTYRSPETAPSINRTSIAMTPNQTIVINVIDAENDVLNITANMTQFYQNGSKIQWNTNSSDAGVYDVLIEVDDGLLNDSAIIHVEVISSVSLTIESFGTIFTNNTYKIFEFVILNDGDTTITDIQWQFDTDDNYIINSTSNISSLAANERAFVYLEYNYSSSGSHTVTANATGLSQSAIVSSALSLAIDMPNLEITSFENISTEATNVIFEAQVKNNFNENISSINWSLDTDSNTIINATQLFNLQPNETAFIFVNYDYGTAGTFNPVFSATNGTYSDSKSIVINIQQQGASSGMFVDTTETNWSAGTFYKTNLTGLGVGANVTLNWTTIGRSGCKECGNMSAGQLNYTMTGNYTSKVFDTGSTTSTFDRIKWKSTLANSSNIATVAGWYRAGTFGNHTAVFLKNRTHFVNTSLKWLNTTVSFSKSYTDTYTGLLPEDMVGLIAQDDSVSQCMAFFRNGTIAQGACSSFNAALTFSVYKRYTLPQGWNTSKIVGIVTDTINALAFFENGSTLYSFNSGDITTQTILRFTNTSTYSIPLDYESSNIIGITRVKAFNQIAVFFNNGSHLVNVTSSCCDATTISNMTFKENEKTNYPNNLAVVNSTNMTLQTRISNDTITWKAWSNIYNVSRDDEKMDIIDVTQNVGRYIQYKAIFSTPDKYVTPILENVTINYSLS